VIVIVLTSFFVGTFAVYAEEVSDADGASKDYNAANNNQNIGDNTFSDNSNKDNDNNSLANSLPAPDEDVAKIDVTDIEIDEYKNMITIDETVELTVMVLPAGATDSVVSYISSNPSVATVSGAGKVKGIAKGDVIITISAGGVTRQIAITVTGAATTGIELDKTLLVLKPGQTYRIVSKVMPADAPQALTFTSLDSSVAYAAADGTVKAIRSGNTTIMISNGDMSAAVTIIVNANSAVQLRDATDMALLQGGDVQDTVTGDAIANGSNADIQTFVSLLTVSDEIIKINVADYPLLTSAMLRSIADTDKTIDIYGDDYVMSLRGADITNTHNELLTQIDFTRSDKGQSFTINEGGNLPGVVRLSADCGQDDAKLYLYNASKKKYESVDFAESGVKPQAHVYALNISGKYLLTADNPNPFSVNKVILIVVGAVLVIGIATYIVVKRRYWFW
jgi:uncharacterized protein YjdB